MHAKMKVLTLVERKGRARSIKVDTLRSSDLRPHLVTKADRKSRLVTDEAGYYKSIGKEFAGHETVNHSQEEYVRGDVHTNTVENYFSVFKRGMRLHATLRFNRGQKIFFDSPFTFQLTRRLHDFQLLFGELPRAERFVPEIVN